MEGSSRTVNPACAQYHRRQVSKGLRKRPVEFKPCCETLLSKNLGTHCREWPAKKKNKNKTNQNKKTKQNKQQQQQQKTMQKCKCSLKPTASRMASWSTRTARWQGTSLAESSHSSRVEDSGSYRCTSSSLSMELEAIAHTNTAASLPKCQTDYTRHILTESMDLRRKKESGSGCSDWHTAMHCLQLQRLLSTHCPNGQTDWQTQQTSHLVCSLAGRRCIEIWGTFWTWTGQSITQHWSPEGKSRGQRKRPTLYCARSGTICVQPDKHWHCFKGNPPETAERRGGARFDLFERYNAILSRNWNWILWRSTGQRAKSGRTSQQSARPT